MTLSPSDKQFEKFILELGKLAPVERAAKKRVADQDENDLSVVTLISIGDQAILLGADLTEIGDNEVGWSAIVTMPERPAQLANIFKIPHHGSANGHCQEVWEQMLIANPIAVLTPWSKNRGLPTASDVERILDLSEAAFSTSMRPRKRAARPYSVQKQIRETVGRIRPLEAQTGFVRLRNGGAKNAAMWGIELSEQACHLREFRIT
jgi:hypothetical protein